MAFEGRQGRQSFLFIIAVEGIEDTENFYF
jgi:hypothetical protein